MWSHVDDGEHVTGSAKRRRERRLRQWLRHERMTVAMALAEAQHHAAPRRQKPASAITVNDAPRGQKNADAEYFELSFDEEVASARGMRPAALWEPRPQERVLRHTAEQIADSVPVVPLLFMVEPQKVELEQVVGVLKVFDQPLPEQVIEVPKIVCPPRGARTVLCAPQTAEQLVAVRTEPGYALAVVAVQTLGWTAARALFEQLAASPGRDINTGQG